MAALTNVRDTSELGGKYIALPVKGATTIYQGSIVAIDATGYAIPGKKATGLKAAGRAEETVENKGGDGEAVIRVARGVFIFENRRRSPGPVLHRGRPDRHEDRDERLGRRSRHSRRRRRRRRRDGLRLHPGDGWRLIHTDKEETEHDCQSAVP
mgnify:CR=1 FL=1